jgi:hypothetical protein
MRKVMPEMVELCYEWGSECSRGRLNPFNAYLGLKDPSRTEFL